MRCLSLFSGIGAHDLGLEMAGITIAGQVEIDPYCTAVLEQHWPDVPRWADVRTLTGDAVRDRCGRIDLITGGFPCQDISAAGKGVGLHGDRSALFFELVRIIGEVRPTWFLLENVPALRRRGADRVLAELDGLGYARWPCVVGAWAVGAPHKRDRVWIVGKLADDDGDGRRGATVHLPQRRSQQAVPDTVRPSAGELDDAAQRGQRADGCARGCDGHADQQGAAELVHAAGVGLEGHGAEPGEPEGHQSRRPGPPLRWPARPGEAQYEWEAPRLIGPTEPVLGIAASRVARRLAGFARRNALKALGNANPPWVPYVIGCWMLTQEDR